jgi:flagellar basal-body rod protein FlgC
MDIFRALHVSASGLAAQRTRMDVVAENLANSETTTTATGGPYRRKLVFLEAARASGLLDPTRGTGFLDELGAASNGVRVAEIRESPEAPRRVFQPDHPHAGPDGFVALPNVSPLKEMVDMMLSTRAYEANATAFQATKTMGARLLELLR